MNVIEREIAAQRSWILANAEVELAITQLGGHMAPVYFCRNEAPVQPYYISPWQTEGLQLPAGDSEAVQRGDFFCLPFGADSNPNAKEKFPPHGETCSSRWNFVSSVAAKRVHTLTIECDLHIRAGNVTRSLSLVDGENVIYDDIVITGFAGPSTYAHHAMLRAPAQEESLLISTSPFAVGMTSPHPTAAPDGGRQALASGREFNSLEQVQGFADSDFVDCSHWPARKGCTDLLQLASNNVAGFAWTAAVNRSEGYVWFALKDVATLPTTVVWMENCGRGSTPYNRRTCVIGLEDACTFFDRGIAESATPNTFSSRGLSTHRELSGEPFSIRYIQGAVKTPPGFGKVQQIVQTASGIQLTDALGNSIDTAVQTKFLNGIELS